MDSSIKIFFILFSFGFKLFTCSIPDLASISKCVIKTYEDSQERDLILAKESILWSMTPFADKKASIFIENIDMLCENTGRGRTEQYIRLIDALCEYITQYCLDSIKSFKQRKMSTYDIMTFSTPLKRFANEILHFCEFLADEYDIPERTAAIILRSIETIEPFSEESFLAMSGLAFFCTTKACIDPFFKMVKKSLPKIFNARSFVSGFNINKNLKAHAEFDQFIRDLMTSPLNETATDLGVTKTIITGPCTDYTNEVMLSLFNDETIAALSEKDFYIQKLAYRGNNSNLIQEFLDRIHPINQCAVYLRSKLESYRADYETILIFKEIDYDNLEPTQAVTYKTDALNEYYYIDRELVVECVLKMNAGVFKLIERATNQTDELLSCDLIQSAITVLGLMSTRYITEVNVTSYEIILDFVLSNINLFVKGDIQSRGMRNILRLPHAEVTPSTLQKFCAICRHFYNETDVVKNINLTFFTVLQESLQLPETRFINLFKMIHRFCDENDIDFTINSSICLLFSVRDYSAFIGDKFLAYCETNKLAPKIQIEIARKRLRNPKSSRISV